MFTLKSPLSTCDSTFHPLVSSRGDPFIPRRAVDPRGRIGCLYDACEDRVILEDSRLQLPCQKIRNSGRVWCDIQRALTGDPPNLMAHRNMADNLRLSVILGLTKPLGVGALVNHVHPIDRYTRLISCTGYMRTDYIADDDFYQLYSAKRRLAQSGGTHVIVLVNYGLDVNVILQLPHDASTVTKIDSILKKLVQQLSQRNFQLTNDEKKILDSIEKTFVYSNEPLLVSCRTIIEFAETLVNILHNDKHEYQPYNYSLCPIGTLFTTDHRPQSFSDIHYQAQAAIEEYALSMRIKVARIKKLLNSENVIFKKHCEITLNAMHLSYEKISKQQQTIMSKLRQAVLDYRRTNAGIESVFPLEGKRDFKEHKEIVDKLYQQANSISRKETFIEALLPKDFEYSDINAYNFGANKKEEELKRQLFHKNPGAVFLCMTDELYDTHSERWNKLVDELQKKRDGSSLKLVCADFSYSDYPLDSFKVWQSSEPDIDDEMSKTKRPQPSTFDRNEINILLVGESGAGKSTFINALANYLRFSSFDEAEKKEPVVLLPISFLLTSGDDFKPHEVKFDGLDKQSSENFQKAGDSVTQSCKSYMMTMTNGQFQGKMLRFIDTPGFGDTRGIDQDECNLYSMLSYISYLRHLDAVCLVMKPNSTRLSIQLSSFIRQIFDVMGQSVRNHVLFCFTNTRSTFYSAGDSSPMVREILDSLPGEQIPYDKSTVYCFDSEAFRYLVAKKSGFPFETDEKAEYKKSWTRSSSELHRLLEHLINKQSVYDLHQTHPSIQRTRLKIQLLIRPMLESIRNMFRNKVLDERGIKDKWIALLAEPFKRPQRIIDDKSGQIIDCGGFWMRKETYSEDCSGVVLCRVAFHRIKSECIIREHGHSTDHMENRIEKFLKTLSLFDCFLESSGSKVGIVLNEWKRMLEEEEDVLKQIRGSSEYNQSLRKYLLSVFEKYKEFSLINKNGDVIDISVVQQEVEKVSSDAMIRDHLGAIKKTSKCVFDVNQFKWPNN